MAERQIYSKYIFIFKTDFGLPLYRVEFVMIFFLSQLFYFFSDFYYIVTPILHKYKKSKASVSEPYVLSDGVRVQASLACINSLRQEVAFDPNTQNLAQNTTDTKYILVGEGCALAGKCSCVTHAQDCKSNSRCVYCFNMFPRNIKKSNFLWMYSSFNHLLK